MADYVLVAPSGQTGDVLVDGVRYTIANGLLVLPAGFYTQNVFPALLAAGFNWQQGATGHIGGVGGTAGTGTTGVTGHTGAAGNSGATGRTGVTGVTGVTGTTGQTGTTGV